MQGAWETVTLADVLELSAMPILTLELTDEQAQMLAKEAERLHLTPHELALRRLLTPLPPPAAPDFEDALQYVFSKNAELYRRLA